MNATKMSSNEFAAALDECGFTLITPAHPEFKVWGYVDVGLGPWVDRWQGGYTLAEQLAFLKKIREARDAAEAAAPKKVAKAPTPKAAKKVAKKAAKKAAKKKVLVSTSKKKGAVR